MSSKNRWLMLLVLVAAGLGLSPAHAAVHIQHWSTPNGARVYFVENHDLPLLDVAVWFDAGSRRDGAQRAGLAGLTNAMMAKGAAGLDETTQAARLAAVGAQFAPAFDRDRAGFTLRTLAGTREREEALTLLENVLARPDFPEDVLEREKQRVLAALREAATQPDPIAHKAFYKALYGGHPYGLPPEGEEETVAALRRDDLVAFHRDHYAAEAAVVILVGDLTRVEAEAIAARLVAKLPQRAVAAPLAPPDPPPAQELRLPHPASQAHILMGGLGMRRLDPDYFPLLVGNYVLGGGGFDARLLKEVRQKRGLAYSAYSYFLPLADLGPFEIGVQTKKVDAPEVLRVVRATLERFLREGPTPGELAQAKNNLVLGFPLRIDSNRKILDMVGVIGFYGLPLTWMEDYPRAVAKVTAAAVVDALRRRIDPARLVTVVVGGPETH